MEIRLINKTEIVAVHKLINTTITTSWPAYYPQFSIDYVLKEELTLDKIRNTISTSHFYVVHGGETIIGCGGISACKESLTESVINTFFVSPRHQGKGIGKLIIRTLENDEYGKRAQRIEVPSSIAGLPFYIKSGYTHKGGKLNYKDGQFILEKFKKE